MKFYYLLCVLLLSVSTMHAVNKRAQEDLQEFKAATSGAAVAASLVGLMPLAARYAPSEAKLWLYAFTGVGLSTYLTCAARGNRIIKKRASLAEFPSGGRSKEHDAYLQELSQEIINAHRNKALVGEVVGAASLVCAAYVEYFQK